MFLLREVITARVLHRSYRLIAHSGQGHQRAKRRPNPMDPQRSLASALVLPTCFSLHPRVRNAFHSLNHLA